MADARAHATRDSRAAGARARRSPGSCKNEHPDVRAPTTDTKLTHRPGAPPRLWVRPSFGSAIWRGPASPRSCSHISYIMRRPEAPIGWPKRLEPAVGIDRQLAVEVEEAVQHVLPRGAARG